MEVISLGGAGEDVGEMARDVRAGLAASPKDLSPWPKYFYDEEGSRLFEEITAQPEYYQTGAELEILQRQSAEIVRLTRCRELVELGSGSASKTRALIEAMFAADGIPPRYVPLDVSESALRESGERLVSEYPGLEIRGFIGDFDAPWDACSGARRTARGSSPFSAAPSATSPHRSAVSFSAPCGPGCATGTMS